SARSTPPPAAGCGLRKAAAGSKHYPQVGGRCPIPKGLRPPAQGCEERATLGTRKNDHQPQRGCDPNAQPGRNPVGVDAMFRAISQGSSFLATLGFGSESLWDSQSVGTCKMRVIADGSGSANAREDSAEFPACPS